jgi:hypothetical protein
MVCHQFRPDVLVDGDAYRSLASVLAFYPRGSRKIAKLVELWQDPAKPFVGSCSGLALVKDLLYVTDDSYNQGWLLGFAKADLQRQLDNGTAPGIVYLAVVKDQPMKINLPYTASGLYYDDDLRAPRLWVSETVASIASDQTPFPGKNGRGAAYIPGRRLAPGAVPRARRVQGSPSPTGTPSGTPPRTPSPLPSAQLVDDGYCTFNDFENGTLAPYVANDPDLVTVVESADNLGRTTRLTPLTGSFMARLVAGVGANEYTTLSLVLKGRAGMNFSYDILFDSGDSGVYWDDAAAVSIVLTSQGDAGSWRTTTTQLNSYRASDFRDSNSQLLGASPWKRGSHILPATGTHVLQFRVRNHRDNELPSALLVDNVVTCALPHDYIPEPTPSPSATPDPVRAMCSKIVNAALDRAETPANLPVQCCSFEEYADYTCAFDEKAWPTNPAERAKMAAYVVDPTTGQLKGWGDTGLVIFQMDETSDGPPSGAVVNNVRPTVEFNIGEDVRGAIFGYREYAGGPQYIILNRCPIRRGADCKLEFHEVPKDAAQAGTLMEDLTEQAGTTFGGAKKTFTLVVGTGNKPKSQQNGGDAKMDTGVSDGGVTLVQVLRVPTMAAGINLEPQAQGLAVTRHLAMTFMGCTQQEANVVRRFGLDCEDQLRLSTFPVIRAFKPAITANIVYFRLFFIDLFEPICLIPVSKDCKGNIGGAGEDSEGPSEPTRASRTLRRLLYAQVTQHDGAEGRDSFVASAVAGRDLHARRMSHVQTEARAQLPLAWGVTLLPPGPAAAAAAAGPGGGGEEPSLRDLSGSLGVTRPIAQPKRFVAPPDDRFAGNPYGRLYGALWHGGAAGRAAVVAAAAHEGAPAAVMGGNASSVAVSAGSRRLKLTLWKLIKLSSPIPGLFGPWGLGDLSPYGGNPGCLSGSQNLYSHSAQIFDYGQTIIIYGVPLLLKAALNADFKVDIGGAVCVDRREAAITLIPHFRLRGSGGVGLTVQVLRVGVGVEANLLTTALVPLMMVGLDTAGGFRAAFELRLVISPIGMRMFAFVQTFLINIFPPGLCLKGFVPAWCPEMRVVVFQFEMEPFNLFLFRIASGPYDKTPPKLGTIKFEQNDPSSGVLKHDGFTDPDSDIDHYELALGSQPGSDDYASWRNVGDRTQQVFKGLDWAIRGNCVPVYASIRAYNGELQMRAASSPKFLWDSSAPEVTDMRAMRSVDNMFSKFTCLKYSPDGTCAAKRTAIYSNSQDQLAVRFAVGESCPASNITRLQFAVGNQRKMITTARTRTVTRYNADFGRDVTVEETYYERVPFVGDWMTNVMGWTDVGQTELMESKSTEPYYVQAAGLDLEGGNTYSILLKSTNNNGATAIFQSPDITVDRTPPTPISIMPYFVEHVAAWRFSTWIAPGWSWGDTESGVLAHAWKLTERETGETMVEETFAGELESGLGSALLAHGSYYCVQVKAQNHAGEWSDWAANCTLVDVVLPVQAGDGVVLSDAGAPPDGWLQTVVATEAQRATRAQYAGRLPSGTLDMGLWDATMIAANGEEVPYADATSFHYEMLWDMVFEPFRHINVSLANPDYINGQQGPHQVVRLRFAVGDADTYVQDVSRQCTVSGGHFKGSDSIFSRYPLGRSAPTFVYAAGAAAQDARNSPAWAPGAPPGVYSVLHGFGYYDMLVRYPAAGWSGYTLYASLTCADGAGNTVRSFSYYGTMIDQTPPAFLEPRIKAGARQDHINRLFQNDPSVFNVSWHQAFVDTETAVGGVTVWLGSSPGADDIAPARFVAGLEPSWSAYEYLQVPHGTRVYASLVVQNVATPPVRSVRINASSVLVDLTPAVCDYVADGHADMPGRAYRYSAALAGAPSRVRDIDFSSYRDAAFGAWNSTDPESGVWKWEATITNELGDAQSGWREMYDTSGHILTDAPLAHGAIYRLAVRTINRAGTTTAPSLSNGFTVDLTRPSVGGLAVTSTRSVPYERTDRFTTREVFTPGVPAPIVSGADPVYRLVWDADDDLSGVGECMVELGTFRGGSDVLPRLSLGNVRSFNGSTRELGFVSGQAYYSTVTCYNRAGLLELNYSTAVGVDVTPPLITEVVDARYPGSTIDMRFNDAVSVSGATWGGTDDMHTGLVGCWAALGVDVVASAAGGATSAAANANRTRFVPWTWVGTANQIWVEQLALPTNVRLRWSVSCVDFVGNAVNATSSGYVVDTTPPMLPAGATAVLDGSFDAILPNGTVRFYDDDDDWWTVTDQFLCRFPYLADPESGLVDFAVFLATTNSTAPLDSGPGGAPRADALTPLLLTRGERLAYFEGLNLTAGQRVFCVVTAINGNDANATWVSDGATVDTSPPACQLRVVAGNAAFTVDAATRSLTSAWGGPANFSLGVADAGVALFIRCTDADSGVLSLDVTLGSNPGEGTLLPLASVPLPAARPADGGSPVAVVRLTRAQLRGYADWRDGVDLYWTVRARNGANLTAVAFAAPFVLDDSPPAPASGWDWPTGVVFGPSATTSQPLAFSRNGSHVTVSLELVDGDSGVAAVQVGFSAYRGVVPPAGLPWSTSSVGGGLVGTLAPETLGFVNVPRADGRYVTVTFALPTAVATAVAGGEPWVVLAIARAVNTLGLEARYRSAPLVLTTRPPVCSVMGGTGATAAFVLDGLGAAGQYALDARGDAAAQGFGGTLYARYACSDAASGIARYELAVDVRVNGSWVPMCAPVDQGTATVGASASGCDVADGGTYRVRVEAFNGVGLSTVIASDGVSVDTSPPTARGLVMLPGARGSPTVHTARSWLAFNLTGVADTGAGIASVRYSVGRLGDAAVQPWTDITAAVARGQSVFNVTGLTLALGARLEISVVITNGVKLSRTLSTPTFLVDFTGPTVGDVLVTGFSLPERYFEQAVYLASPASASVVANASVAISITGYADPQSGVASLAYALFLGPPNTPLSALPTSEGALSGASALVSDPATLAARLAAGQLSLVAPLTPVDAGDFALAPSLTLIHDGTLYAVVLVTNTLGQAAVGYGTPFNVRLGRMSAGTVNDGWAPGVQARGLPANNGVWATWRGFVDAAGLEISYSVAWGTTRGGEELVPRMRVGGERPFAASVVGSRGGEPFALPDGTTVYATVTASNAQGASVVAYSPGSIVDGSSPLLSYVGLGAVRSAHDYSTESASRVAVNWECADPHSGLDYITVSLGADASAPTSLLAPVRVSGAAILSGVLVTNITAVLGAPLVARVTCVNVAGLASVATSLPSYVDNSPPAPRLALGDGAPLALASAWPATQQSMSGVQYLNRTSRFYIVWDVLDLESGIFTNEVCLGGPAAVADAGAGAAAAADAAAAPGPPADILPCTRVPTQAVVVVSGSDSCAAALAAVADAAPSRSFTCLRATNPNVTAALAHGDFLYATLTVTNHARMAMTLTTRAQLDTLGAVNNGTMLRLAYAARNTAHITFTQSQHVASDAVTITSVRADPAVAYLLRPALLEVLVGPWVGTLTSPIAFYTFRLRCAGTTVIDFTRVPLGAMETDFTAAAGGGGPFPSGSRLAALVPPSYAFVPSSTVCGLQVFTTVYSGVTTLQATLTVAQDAGPPEITAVAIADSPAKLFSPPAGWADTTSMSVSWSAVDDTGVNRTEIQLCDGTVAELIPSPGNGSLARCFTPWITVNGSMAALPITGRSVSATAVLDAGAFAQGTLVYAKLRLTDMSGERTTRNSPVVLVDRGAPVPGRLLAPRRFLAMPKNLLLRFTPFLGKLPVTAYYACLLPTNMSGALINGSAVPEEAYLAKCSFFSRTETYGFKQTLERDVTTGVAMAVHRFAMNTIFDGIGALEKALEAVVNVTLVVIAENGAGRRGMLTTDLVFDGTPPAADPGYVANPVDFALTVHALQGTPATLPPSGGLVWARPSALGGLPNASALVRSLPKVASPATADMNVLYVGWVGLVDPESGLNDTATLVLRRCPSRDTDCREVVRQSVSLAPGLVALPGLAVTPGAEFHGCLTVWNGAGDKFDSCSTQPLVVDTLPPVLTTVADGFPVGAVLPPGWPAAAPGDDGDSDAGFWASNTTVAGSWNATDNSGIAEYRWAVCRATVTYPSGGGAAPSADCPLPLISAGSATSAFTSLGAGALLQGSVYRTWVVAVDLAGNTNASASDGFVVDLTPPVVAGAVADVPTFAASWRSLRLGLGGMVDPESAIAQVAACVSVGAWGSRPSLRLLPACVPLNLSAVSAPTLGSYFGGLSVNMTARAAAAVANATAAAAIADDILAAELEARSGPDGGPTFLAVTFLVTNRAGLTSVAAGGAALVDPSPVAATIIAAVPGGERMAALGFNGSGTPPPLGALRTAADAAAARGRLLATRNTTTLGLAWYLAPGPSGIASVWAAAGTVCGAADIAKPLRADADAAGTALFTSLDLNHGDVVYLSINVTSGAGLVSTLCAPPVLVDLVAPAPGLVADGDYERLALAVAAAAAAASSASPAGGSASSLGVLFRADGGLSAAWAPFSDDESGSVGSGLVSYAVRVCEAAGVCLTNWTDVGAVTSATLGHLNLRPGVSYRLHVRGTDGAGNSADAVSPGQILDDSPPVPPARLILTKPFIAGWDELGVEFEEFVDAESGVDRYELSVRVRTRGGLRSLLNGSSIGAATRYGLAGEAAAAVAAAWRGSSADASSDDSAVAPIDDGLRPAEFEVVIRAVNRAGLSSQRSTRGRLDDTPPTIGQIAFRSVDALPGAGGMVLRQLDGNATGVGADGDVAPPRVEALVADEDLSSPPRFQVSRQVLALGFKGFVDAELSTHLPSDTLVYAYAVGTAPGGDDVVRWSRFWTPDAITLNVTTTRGVERLPGSDQFMVHTAQLSSLDLPNGVTLFAAVRAYNPAGLFSTAVSTALTIDATTPQSSHPQPLIDLQARIQEGTNTTGSVMRNVTYKNTTSPERSSAGYNGVGSDAARYDAQTAGQWADSDWSGTQEALSFAWRGWEDPQSGLDHIEYSVVELGEPAGYAPEGRTQVGSLIEPSAPLNLAASYGAYLSGALGTSRRLARSLAEGNAAAPARVSDAEALGWTVFNGSLSNDECVDKMCSVLALSASRALPSSELLRVAYADAAGDLPDQVAYRGRLMSGFEQWGGRPLTGFTRAPDGGADASGALSSGTGNVTIMASLTAGRVYGVALRAYSRSSQFTQLLSDGVRVDSNRGAPCFGLIQVGPVARRRDSAGLAGVVAGTLTGLPRPAAFNATAAPAGGDNDASRDSFGSATSADPNSQRAFSPFADRLQLNWMHYADPYVQRPTALQRLSVCPEVDGYGSDWNALYAGPGDAPQRPAQERYQLPFAPIARYSFRIKMVWDPDARSPWSSGAPAATATTDATGAKPVSADVALHEVEPGLLPRSDACCSGGLERHEPASSHADIELRPVAPLTGFGRAMAVVAPPPGAAAEQGARSYAVVAADGAVALVPLHHSHGAYQLLELGGGGGVAALQHISVAASRAPSGRLPLFDADVGAMQPDERAPAFAVASSAGEVRVYEVHADLAAAGRRSAMCTPPACAQDTGHAFEDLAALSLGEQAFTVAVLRRDGAVFAGAGFGRSLAVHNATLAVGGQASAALRSRLSAAAGGAPFPASAGAVQVCENAVDPLAAFTDTAATTAAATTPAAAAAAPYRWAWGRPVCAVLAAPSDAVAPTTSAGRQQVPFLATVDAQGFGTALALADGLLAVGAPATAVFYGSSSGAVLMDSVQLFTLPRGPANRVPGATAPLNASDPVYGLQANALTAALLNAASAPRPLTLVDPVTVTDASVPGARTFAHSGFGSALDATPDGRLLLVGAPAGSGGRGRVYAYTLPGAGDPAAPPALACYWDGAHAGFSRLGESVQALAVAPSAVGVSDATVGLAVVSFHGLVVGANGSIAEVPATAVLAVRAPGAAATQGAFQRAVRSMSVSAPLLAELGVPRCALVALIGSNATLDARVQLGLASGNATVDAAVGAFLAAATRGGAVVAAAATRPVVAAAGSNMLLSDAAAQTWLTPRYTSSQMEALQASNISVSALLEGANASASLASLVQPSVALGSGRVWHTAFCPRDAVRRRAEQQFAVVPFVCRRCMAQATEVAQASFGGLSSICASCPRAPALCTGGLNASGALADTLFELTDSSLSLKHRSIYRVFVRGTTASGRFMERLGPLVQIDVTPPIAPETGLNDGYYNNKCATNDCNLDVAYTSDLTSASVWHAGFTEDASGIDHYEVGVSTSPCTGRLLRNCTLESVLVDAYAGIYKNMSSCSELELDYRMRWAAVLRAPRWEDVGTPAFPIPFDVDAPGAFNVAPLTPVGFNTTWTWSGLRVKAGTHAFGCVIAYNRAGLRTVVTSNGVVYDATAPILNPGSVRDGIGGPDFDQQAMLDGLVANWEAYDYESGSQYHVWAITRDPFPVLDAYLDLEAGYPVDWNAVQGRLATTLVHWEVVPASHNPLDVAKVANVSLVKDSVYYAAVRTLNRAGLWSNIEVSDGVTVGKNELKVDPTEPAAVGFDATSASSTYASPEEKRAAEGGTVGSLALPAGGLGNGTQNDGKQASSIVAGAMDEDDFAGNSSSMPDAVDPATTKAPKRNLQFGDYSFGIKAKDDSGTIIDGFRFAKPMLINLFYDVPKGLPAGERYAPQLNLYNIETAAWEPAYLSCPEPDRFESIDPEARLYSVHICHLTQFGVYYQQPPVTLVRMPPGALPLADVATMALLPEPRASEYVGASAGFEALPPLVWPLSQGAPSPVLDASQSYDPDGHVRSIVWAVTGAPSLAGAAAELARGDITPAEYDAAVAAVTAAVLTPGGVLGSQAVVAPTAPGTWRFAVTVMDMDNVTAVSNVTVVFNLPPVLAFSRPYYTPPSLVEEFGSAPAAEFSESADGFMALAAQAGPDDVVLDASLTVDPDGAVAHWVWSIDVNASKWDPASEPAFIDAASTGPFALLRNAARGLWTVRLTASDAFTATASATVVAGEGLNALATNGSVVYVTSDEFVLDASATVSSFPLAELNFAWGRLGYDADSESERYLPLPAAPGSGAAVAVANVTALGEHLFRVVAVDPYGRADKALVTVVRHLPPVALVSVTLPTPATAQNAPNYLWCGPAWQVRLSAAASFDPDGAPVTVAWAAAYTPADVNASFANDVFAPVGGAPLFAPLVGNDTTTVEVANKLPMGHYAVTAAVTDAVGAVSVSAPAAFSVGADGWVVPADAGALPEDAVRPEYACSARPTSSQTTTGTPSASATGSQTPSNTGTRTNTRTGTPSPSQTASHTPSPSQTRSTTASVSVTPPATVTATRTGSNTRTQTPTPSVTPTGSLTGSPSDSASTSGSRTASATASGIPSGTASVTPRTLSRSPTASFTPLPPAPRALRRSTVLVARIGPLVAPGLQGVFLDELAPAPFGTPYHAEVLQTLRLPCVLPATLDTASGLGGLVTSADGESVALACAAPEGGAPLVASLTRGGVLRVAAAAPCEQQPGGGACAPALAEAGATAADGGAAAPPLAVAAAGFPPAFAAVLAGARFAATRASDGAVVLANASGIFGLLPTRTVSDDGEGGELAATAPPTAATPAVRLVAPGFNRTAGFQPALVHVTDAGELYAFGKPRPGELPGAACGLGREALYRFAPDAATGAYACVGRYPRLGRTLFRNGRGLAGYATSDGYSLFVTTDAEAVECTIAAPEANTNVMACREMVTVDDVIGARFLFRGVGVLRSSA